MEVETAAGWERGRPTLLVMSGTTMLGFVSTFPGVSGVTHGGKLVSCFALGGDVSSVGTGSGTLLEFAKH